MGPLGKLGYLSPSRTIFLLCDVQDKFRAMNCFAEFCKNIKKVIEAGKALDIPLIVSEHYPEKLGSTVAELNIDHAVKKFPKTKFSMVVPEISDHLKTLNDVDDVVLMGLEAHICLEQTAMDLLSLNKFNVHVVADCALSRTADDRALALNRLEKMGCIVTSSENVLFKLIKDKNHPKFNIIRDLVATPSVFPNKL